MQTAIDAIAQSLRNSQAVLHRYSDDLAPAEYLHRTSPKANCAAWVIGHLALTDRKALTHLGVADLPPLPAGFEQRFGRDESSAMASDFGDVTALLPVFDQHRNALIDAVSRATPEQLNRPLEKPGAMFKTPGEFAHYMSLHTAMHAGQLTLIRRSLGRPPVV